MPGVPMSLRESREEKTLVPATCRYCTTIRASLSKEKNDLNFKCRVYLFELRRII